jgi:co-chaperonin GroES (HSP10)
MTEILIGQNPDSPTEVTVLPATPEEKARQLPIPTGYNILCAIPEAETTYDSGIVKADQTMHYENLLTVVLFVVAIGPDAYKDHKKFPSGPWCKEGDFVMVRTNSGSRFKIHGREFRMIHDDVVEGVVQDPRGIARA